MNEHDFDKEFMLESAINKLRFDKVLDALGSDYDEHGVPYWENND